MGLQSTLPHKERHATGGSDALTPADIGAQYDVEYRQHTFTTSNQDTPYAVASGRNTNLSVSSYVLTADAEITLPRSTDGAVRGDRILVYHNRTGHTRSLLVTQYVYTGSDYLGTRSTLATIASGGTAFVFGGVSWAAEPVSQHTHAIADTTGLQSALDGKAPALIRTTQTITGDTLLASGRNQRVGIGANSTISAFITLPFQGNQLGDTLTIIGQRVGAPYSGSFTVRQAIAFNGGIPIAYSSPLATITSENQSFTFVFSGGSWAAEPVSQHKSTHATGGTDALTPSDIGAVAKSGDTMTGKLSLPASTTSSASFNIGVGANPTNPQTGDLWANSNTLLYRHDGLTRFVAMANQLNLFSRNQVIDVNDAAPALRITQRSDGEGSEALRVEDSTSPDSTAFVISKSGRVGVGVEPDAVVGLKLDSTGVKFSDDTVQTTAGIPAAEKGAVSGVATLDSNQKLTASQIPDIAITDFLGACANQAEMLAKTGQKGDWVTRADDGKVYVITGNTPSQAGSWTALTYPASPVTSVNSKTGAVVLSAADVGAAPTGNYAVRGFLEGENYTSNPNPDTHVDYAQKLFYWEGGKVGLQFSDSELIFNGVGYSALGDTFEDAFRTAIRAAGKQEVLARAPYSPEIIITSSATEYNGRYVFSGYGNLSQPTPTWENTETGRSLYNEGGVWVLSGGGFDFYNYSPAQDPTFITGSWTRSGGTTATVTIQRIAAPAHASSHATGGPDPLTPSSIGAVAKSGDTMTGKLTLPASTTTSAPINIPHGLDPTSPSNGDIWLNGSIRYRDQAGNTRFVADLNRPNTFSQRQVINADQFTTLPALRITQEGTGDALRVEDESPETTPFVVSNSGRVGVGVTPDATVALKVDSTGIKFGDNTVQTTAALGLSADSYIIARPGDDLAAKYTAAKALTPMGLAKSATNRASLIIFPGTYSLDLDLAIDTEFVDVIGLGAQTQNPAVILNGGINAQANNVRVSGISVSQGVSVGNNKPLQVWENCTSGGGAFSAPVVSGTFINCVGGDQSFALVYLLSESKGTFINCQAGAFSFGDFATGYFKDCVAGKESFGNMLEAKGTFINCKGGLFSFNQATGIFINCEAGEESFGAYGPCSGTFINCSAESGSFGSADNAPVTGKLFGCRITKNGQYGPGFGTLSPPLSGKAIMVNCVDANGDIIEGAA